MLKKWCVTIMIKLNDSEREVVRKVIEDMQQNCGIFRGTYDPRSGNTAFMLGILTTMETLAYYVDEVYAGEQDLKFVKNMARSEKKIKEGKKEWWKLWSK